MLPEPIFPGEKKFFSFTAMIPDGFQYSTTIGSIISRFQVLDFSSRIGNSFVGARCQILLFFNSKSQFIEVAPQVSPPAGWKPKVANQVVYTNLPPFDY
jgi:hypothetical protein